MIFSTAIFGLASVLAVSAKDILVTVGDSNSLAFNPTSVQGVVGDNVIFNFIAKNHSLTQSTFAAPCQPQGIDSGFQFVDGSGRIPQFNITLNATTPLWFYCAQTAPVSHCQSGMVFAINPTADKSFDMFQAAAKAGNTTSASSGAPAASGPAGAGSAAPSGFVTTSSSPTGSASAGASPSSAANSTGATNSTNGALSMSGNAAGVLAVFGLIASLAL